MQSKPYHKLITHPALGQASLDAKRLGLSSKVYQAFRAQFHSALGRKIDFQFTIEDWWNWWQTYDPAHGCVRWSIRGRGMGGVMMGRYHDTGPYHPDNVYCASAKDNLKDTVEHYDFSAPSIAWHATHDCHLKGKRGDAHPKSQAVLTERGRFGSIALASEAFGFTRQAGFYRVRSGRWSLIE